MNMALDSALLDAVSCGQSPPTLRFYGWNAPAISVGHNQDVARTLRVGECSRHGITLVRRPTGGRGVLHGFDITLSLCVPMALLGARRRSVAESHRWIMAGIAAALASLGHPARPGTRAARWSANAGDCFATSTCADLVYDDGAKAAGAAQARRSDAMLEQVSVPRERTGIAPQDVFVGPAADGEARLHNVPIDGIIAGFIHELSGMLHCRWEDGDWTAAEKHAAALLIPAVAVDTHALL